MDKKLYKEVEKLHEKELREIVERGELNPESLEICVKALDNLKDISIICAMKKEAEMEEEYSEYSGRYPYMYENDASYARGRYSSKRDSMGRYSRGSYDDSYDRGSYNYARNSYDGYSRTEELENMMREAKTEKERELIRQLMEAKQN